MNNNMNRMIIIGVFVLLVLGIGGYILYGNMKYSRSLGASNQNSNSQNTNSTVPTQGTRNSSSVQVSSNGFQPMNLVIKAGTTVTWTNNSGEDVSINSNNHPTHLLYPPLNLGRVSDGGQVSLTFDTPGTYGYHNHLNPSQTGTITVQ